MRASSEPRLPFRTVSRLALIAVLFCCSLAAHAFPHHENLHKEIEDLEMEWQQAQLTNNTTIIDHLLADDYLGISAYGTLETKADVLAAGRTGKIKIDHMELSDVKIRVYGDTAVVTSRVDVRGMHGDRNITGRYRYTRVYNNRDGQWKIVSFEASRMPGSAESADEH